MLLVRHPPTYAAERRYVLEVVLGELLGLRWEAQIGGEGDVEVVLGDRTDGPRLKLADGLFASPAAQWLKESSVPRPPLERWRPHANGIEAALVEPELPVIYGRRLPGGGFAVQDAGGLTLGVDLLGSIFFELTRYEEIALGAKDEHGRFPAHSSLAQRAGYLHRPLVNEYVEVLRSAMQRLWPSLSTRHGEYRERLSHDVDFPTHFHLSQLAIAKGMVGDLVRRADPSLARARLRALRARIRDQPGEDPYHNFDFIMDTSEEHGVRSAFYFMAGETDSRFDGGYGIDEPLIGRLLRRIHQRGHEIGLHPSYGTFRDPALIRRERDALIRACERVGVSQDSWGGRQHFLRWENPVTWRGWESAELAYDSSLGYSREPGFRCGICCEYPAFDLLERRPLRLRERPLVVMDVALGDGATPDRRALQTVNSLRERCRQFGGQFTLLWHNSMLASARQRRAYRAALAQVPA